MLETGFYVPIAAGFFKFLLLWQHTISETQGVQCSALQPLPKHSKGFVTIRDLVCFVLALELHVALGGREGGSCNA